MNDELFQLETEFKAAGPHPNCGEDKWVNMEVGLNMGTCT